MKIEEIKNEDWYALFAPDGSIQGLTLAPDMATCVASIRMLHKARMSKSFFELTRDGFEVMPVKLTILENGTAEEGFQRAKQLMK